MPFRIENQVLIEYHEEPGVTEVIVPDGVTEIGRTRYFETYYHGHEGHV